MRIAICALGLAVAACSAVPEPVSVASPQAYVLWPKMQERRAIFYSHAELFLADPGSGESRGWYNQTVAMLGREDLKSLTPPDASWFPKFDCVAGDENAADEVIKRAADHTIVILNEDHSESRHRLFIADVIGRLRQEGFTHYAAEALWPGAADRPGSETLDADGWYAHDPVLARLLEDVRASGMTLVEYEQRADQRLPDDAPMEDSIAAREAAQVSNLVEAVLGTAPDTKIIIHVGHGHVQEVPPEIGHKWMAARLKETTGIDPLTVEATACTLGGTGPATVREMSRGSDVQPFWTDIVVRFPELTFTDNRPDYRRTEGMQDIPIPTSLLPEDRSVIIEARRAGDSDEKVPIDRLFLRVGETIPLILPPGAYSIAAFDDTGLVAGPVAVSVAP
ncbi:MAG: hypothetical protein RLO80_08380 [Hyphomonas sp.]